MLISLSENARFCVESLGLGLVVTRRAGINRQTLVLARASSMNDSNEEEEEFVDEELGDKAIIMEDLSWRVEKLRLEEQNTKRFLKAKPRFLPYEECRKWVQAWGQRWQTEEDWRNWIAQGEKRNSYIPSQPDDYYSSLGQWKGWAHFLGSEENEREFE